MTQETGGPAFPQNTKIMLPAGQEVHQGFMGGMTLRDYFAAKAMQAILLDKKKINYWSEEYSVEEARVFVSEDAYLLADAMLEARK